MSTVRRIEYRITRELLQRRENASRHRPADQFIKGMAIVAGAAIVAICLPQLLLPVFVASLVVILGL
jgi:hypothetical protein